MTRTARCTLIELISPISWRRSARESGSTIARVELPGSWGRCYARTAAPKARKATINSSRCGCAALIATFTRRTLVVINAPILMSFRRIEPAVHGEGCFT
jgi:hypothetical protein